ncbi:DUF31 family protein [Mycoplasma zalophi]|uniref:Ig-specific serine endopeptidase MIP n=1 Tax=Mycoplasma zalophi TaxID=191287 RepID=UPI0021C8D2F3|nr:DUF31 family protein [Mycoplasma zalophi]MCU4117247.1 DUF31 family protein [Mycoplasma zalophi]
MKKNNLKYFLTVFVTLGILSPLVAISCANPQTQTQENSKKTDKNNKDNKQVDKNNQNQNSTDTNTSTTNNTALVPQELRKIAAKSFDELFNLSFTRGTKKDYTPETISRQKDDLLNVQLKPNFNSEVESKLLDVKLDDNANATGNLTFVFEIKSKQTSNIIHKQYPLTGFKTTQFGVSDDGTLHTNVKIEQNEIEKYHALNQKQRFEKDNAEYMRGLKGQFQNRGVDVVRSDLKYDQNHAKQFNDIAARIGLDTYENSAYKGFTLPVYDANGKVDGLSFGPSSSPELFSKIDFLEDRDPNRSIGLARMLTNETYRDIALQTFIGNFSYKEEFKEQIAAYQRGIKEVESWDKYPEKLQNYKDNLIKDINFEKESAKLEYESTKKQTKERHDLESLENQYKAKIAKLDEEIKKVQGYTLEFIISEYKKKIEQFKKDAQAGRNFQSASGTLWIIDYEIPEGQSYPTKWFFATNSHVAKLMSNPTFLGFSLTRLNKDVGLNSKLRITGFDTHYKSFLFSGSNIQNNVIKVYDALDYLTSSPKDFLASNLKSKYENIEEMADFAVIEVDFNGLINDGNVQGVFQTANFQPVQWNNNAQELAKDVTNDYYHLDDKKKSHFISESYLKNYEKIDYPLIKYKNETSKQVDELFALGYPVSNEDFFLRRYEDYQEFETKQSYHSLWTNSDYRFYYAQTNGEDGPLNIDEERLKRGNWLSYQIGLRSFVDKPGINDAFIVSPIRGGKLYETYDNGHLKQYLNTGLQYMLRHYVAVGGSSGSSVRNQDYKIVGLHSTIIPAAKTDFVIALRSEGFNYEGAFGTYNLPQYDLIYGGGKDQKTSYRQALKVLHDANKLNNTWLFQHGFDDNNIPEEFKFTNTR